MRAEEDDVSEEWRQIGASRYDVSSLGRVRRRFARGYDGRWAHVLTPHVIWTGYHRVKLSGGARGDARDVYVHVLVAEAFIGPKPEGMQVNHRNGNKADNRAENLEYLTPSENTRHAHALGLVNVARGDRHSSRTRPESVLRGEKHPAASLSDAQVRAIRERYAAGGVTHRALAAEYGCCGSLVSMIVNHKTRRSA